MINMAEPGGDQKLIESVFVTGSTATTIEVSWEVQKENMQNIQGYRVHFQKIGSGYVQNSPMLPPTTKEFSVANLIMDTYYKVCLIMYRNDTAPVTECVDASTANWHIPVSIGSSIGAVLALSIIVFLVFVSRCPSIKRRSRKTVSESGKYDSMSSHAHDDNYELSDTTTQAPDDDMFSDQDSGNFELMQPLHLPSRHHHHHHHSDRPANGNRNFIKSGIPAHVLHMHPMRTSTKPHSESNLYLPRHLSGSPKSNPSHHSGVSKHPTQNHATSPPPRQMTSPKQLLDNHVCVPSSPPPVTDKSDKQPSPLPPSQPTTKGGNHVSTTIPRCSSPPRPYTENQTCSSLPRHMAGFTKPITDQGVIPKQSTQTAKMDHTTCSRQHTV